MFGKSKQKVRCACGKYSSQGMNHEGYCAVRKGVHAPKAGVLVGANNGPAVEEGIRLNRCWCF